MHQARFDSTYHPVGGCCLRKPPVARKRARATRRVSFVVLSRARLIRRANCVSHFTRFALTRIFNFLHDRNCLLFFERSGKNARDLLLVRSHARAQFTDRAPFRHVRATSIRGFRPRAPPETRARTRAFDEQTDYEYEFARRIRAANSAMQFCRTLCPHSGVNIFNENRAANNRLFSTDKHRNACFRITRWRAEYVIRMQTDHKALACNRKKGALDNTRFRVITHTPKPFDEVFISFFSYRFVHRVPVLPPIVFFFFFFN